MILILIIFIPDNIDPVTLYHGGQMGEHARVKNMQYMSPRTQSLLHFHTFYTSLTSSYKKSNYDGTPTWATCDVSHPSAIYIYIYICVCVYVCVTITSDICLTFGEIYGQYDSDI